MNEKKVVASGRVIVLGAICIILAVSLIASYFYQNAIIQDKTTADNSLKSQYDNYLSSHSHTNDDYNALQSSLSFAQSELNLTQADYDTYKSAHNHADTDYSSLTSQILSANSQISSLQQSLNGNVATLAQTVNQLNSTTSDYNTYKSTHSHTDTDYNSLSSQLASANSQINYLLNQLKPEQMVFSHSDYVTVNHSAQILYVGTDAYNASKFTISYMVGSIQSPDIWRIADSMGKASAITNTRIVATANATDINVIHTVTFNGFACSIELYGSSGGQASLYYSITVEAPAGSQVTVIYGQ